MPPNPVTTAGVDEIGVVPQLGAGATGVEGTPPNPPPPKLLVGAGEPKPPGAAPNPAEGVLGAAKPLDGNCAPPLLAPPSFS